MKIKRYLLFAKRLYWGIRFGFVFRGTTKTAYPARLRLGGKWVRLAHHGHETEFSDLIDVLLDDSYGLRRVKHVRNIVDIGANVGLFSSLSRHHFPKATIHAYEPDPITFRMAEQNLAGLVAVYNEGVWSTDGVGRIKRRDPSPLSTQVVADEGGDVRLVSFRTVLARAGGTIDLLKVDCEGAEWTFMKDPDLFRTVRAIRMEYHLYRNVTTIREVHNLATHLGYEISKLEENGPYHGILWLDRRPSEGRRAARIVERPNPAP